MIERIIQFLVLFIFSVWLEYMYLRKYNFHRFMNRDLYEDPFYQWTLEHNLRFPLSEKIVITGLVRNASERIQKNLEYCRLLGSYFHDFKIVIFENDSTDETRKRIKQVCELDKNVKLIESSVYPDCKLNIPILYNFGVINRQRISKMCLYRNICNALIYQHYSDYNYVMVVDFDIEGILPISSLLKSIYQNQKLDWSCICANGMSPLPGTFGNMETMYDAMAFCHNQKDIDESRYGENQSFFSIVKKYIRMMTNFSTQERLISVCSAFNGFCIYKMADIVGLYYTDEFICEHISINHQLIEKKKKIYIDMELRVRVGHQGPHRIIDFL